MSDKIQNQNTQAPEQTELTSLDLRTIRRKDIKIVLLFIGVSIMLILAGWYAYNLYIHTPPYVDPVKYPVRGIDLSSHNGMLSFDGVKQDGYEFVFLKATEGEDFRDSNFRLNYDKASRAGLKIGAYHYFRFDKDGVSQALNLLRAIGTRRLHLGIAIDVESTGNAKNVPIDSIRYRLSEMIDYLNLRGYSVTLYSNRDGYYDYLKDDFRGYPLWICSFSKIPINDDWTFWQYFHHGKVKGIKGDVDLNAFYGSRAEWQQYLRDNTVSPRPYKNIRNSNKLQQ
ncbi:MAG: hypothetical protein NC201_03610 [Prevotella sp.]|nr:hypothetical protein [Bacteroides sp.]MCM1366315.1 hypothetical protein [Prevotella sp.]MCM1437119.1 hypothetical protein [Prevotella sp.]